MSKQRSEVKVQSHTGQNKFCFNIRFNDNPNIEVAKFDLACVTLNVELWSWTLPDNLRLNSPMALKWGTMLWGASVRCWIIVKVNDWISMWNGLKTSPIWSQFQRSWTITLVSIHIWPWDGAQSFQGHGRVVSFLRPSMWLQSCTVQIRSLGWSQLSNPP